jgi:type IX secretion system PorP/SprF family membrane protein
LKNILIVICLLTGRHVSAQYFQFSQFNFAKARVNPAMIATTRYASASILSRTQNTAGDFAISSNFLSLVYPLVNRSTGKSGSGIGITMMDDRSQGIFSNQEVTLNYAINARLTKYTTLSLGFKGLYQTRSIGLEGFTTGLQYVADRGFNTSAPNGESFSQLRSSYATFSAGLHWQQVDKKDNQISYLGISLFDMNKPKDITFSGRGQIESTFVISGGLRVFHRDAISVFPELLFVTSYGSNLLNAGFRFQYDLNSKAAKSFGKVDLLTKYVPGRSVIAGGQFHRENISLGLSYDFPAFTSNSGNLGAFEIGLEVRKLVTPSNSPKKKTNKKKKSKKKSKAKKKSVQQKKPLPKPLSPQSTQPLPVSKTEVIKDSILAITLPIPEQKQMVITVEDNKIDTTYVTMDAKAGAIRQEPYAFEKITLRFHFEFNSVDIDDESEAFLSDLSKTLLEDKNLKLKIVGHTDNRGSVSYNEKLSLRRAESVKKHLLKKGVDPARVETEGKGMLEPIVENDSDENRAKNRRVQILLFRE